MILDKCLLFLWDTLFFALLRNALLQASFWEGMYACLTPTSCKLSKARSRVFLSFRDFHEYSSLFQALELGGSLHCFPSHKDLLYHPPCKGARYFCSPSFTKVLIAILLSIYEFPPLQVKLSKTFAPLQTQWYSGTLCSQSHQDMSRCSDGFQEHRPA